MTSVEESAVAVEDATTSTLHLRFAKSGRALDVLRQDPPWKVVRSFAVTTGESLVHLHNLSGGMLSGDRLRLEVEVEAGARVQLTSTGATRIYRRRVGRAGAVSMNRLQVGAGAVLEFLPDQIIPYADSVFAQNTEITLSVEDAGLFWWETVTPGRMASGEAFRYKQLCLRSSITCEERPIALDRFCLEPAKARPQRIGALGNFLCSSTFYICRTGRPLAEWVELERLLMDEAERLSGVRAVWGASRLVRHGLMVRGIGLESAELTQGLLQFWSLAKRFLYGREAVPPRKVN